MDHVKAIISDGDKLKNLFEDPQPGIFAWNMRVNDVLVSMANHLKALGHMK